MKRFDRPATPDTVEFAIGDETFRCYNSMNLIGAIEVASFLTGDTDSDEANVIAASKLLELLRGQIATDDRDRWDQFLREETITIDFLAELYKWMVEVATDRPTTVSSDLSAGHAPNGDSSAAGDSPSGTISTKRPSGMPATYASSS